MCVSSDCINNSENRTNIFFLSYFLTCGRIFSGLVLLRNPRKFASKCDRSARAGKHETTHFLRSEATLPHAFIFSCPFVRTFEIIDSLLWAWLLLFIICIDHFRPRPYIPKIVGYGLALQLLKTVGKYIFFSRNFQRHTCLR